MRFAELGFVNPLTNEVTVVLTTMREEFGASGYTRGSVVFLGEPGRVVSALASPAK